MKLTKQEDGLFYIYRLNKRFLQVRVDEAVGVKLMECFLFQRYIPNPAPATESAMQNMLSDVPAFIRSHFLTKRFTTPFDNLWARDYLCSFENPLAGNGLEDWRKLPISKLSVAFGVGAVVFQQQDQNDYDAKGLFNTDFKQMEHDSNEMVAALSNWFDINYCPMLQSLSLSLLVLMDQDHAYRLLYACLKRNVIFCDPDRMLASYFIFESLLRRRFPALHQSWSKMHVFSLQHLPNPVFEWWWNWIEKFWIGSLPIETREKCLDLFFIEGETVFYSTAFACISLHQNSLFAESQFQIVQKLHSFTTECYNTRQFFEAYLAHRVESAELAKISKNILSGIMKREEFGRMIHFLHSARLPIFFSLHPCKTSVYSDSNSKDGLPLTSPETKLDSFLPVLNFSMFDPKFETVHTHFDVGKPEESFPPSSKLLYFRPIENVQSTTLQFKNVLNLLVPQQRLRFVNFLHENISEGLRNVLTVKKLVCFSCICDDFVCTLQPILIYNSLLHGSSTSKIFSAYRKALRHPFSSNAARPVVMNSIMFIRTTHNLVIGAFLTHALLEYSDPYFGSSKCFVFCWSPSLQKFGCSTKNNAFISTNDSMIRIGSGNGHALSLDSILSNCSSGYSETFDNCSLVNPNRKYDDHNDDPDHFEIASLEIILLA